MRRLSTAVAALVDRYHRLLSALTEARPFVVLFLAGALSTVAMAPLHFWPVLLFTLPILFWALEETSTASLSSTLQRAVWRGWAFGFGYHFAGLYWIGFSFLVQAERFAVLMPFAVAGLTAGLGLFFAMAGGGYALVRPVLPTRITRLLMLALAVMIAEWLRGHIFTGFPWNILGYALTMPLPLMQWAGVLGIYALTAIVVVSLTSPLVLLARSENLLRSWGMITATTVAPLLLALFYGIWRLDANPTAFEPGVRLRLVQPSFSQKDKFVEALRWPIFVRHLEMSSEGFAGDNTGQAQMNLLPTHIIWPEAAIPFFARRDRNALAAIDRALPDSVQVIVGTFRIDHPPDVPNDQIDRFRVFNSALAIGGDGKVGAIYDKIHLVPFGEYLPARKLLNALGLENLTRTKGGLALGKAPRGLMRVPGLPAVEMLICYEAIFPGELVQTSTRPGVLINLTNDAWFGSTSGPHQHLHQTRLRAVEQGLPMLRSANNGISAIVDPMGRIVARLNLNEAGILDGSLPRPASQPIYSRFRGVVEWAVVIVLLGCITLSAQWPGSRT